MVRAYRTIRPGTLDRAPAIEAARRRALAAGTRSLRGRAGRRRDLRRHLDRDAEPRLDVRGGGHHAGELAGDAGALLAEIADQLAGRLDQRRAGRHPVADRAARALEPRAGAEELRHADLDRGHRLLELGVVDDGDVLLDDLDLRLAALGVQPGADLGRRLALGRGVDVGVAIAAP